MPEEKAFTEKTERSAEPLTPPEPAEPVKTAYIVGAGDFTARGLGVKEADFGESAPAGISVGEAGEPGTEQLLVAADGGLKYLKEIGLRPDLIIGDFDSLGYIPGEAAPGPEILRLPVEKDDTDMAAACRAAWERGFRRLRIYGGSGDRPDHFLANLQLAAAYSRKGGDVRLIAPAFTVFAVTEGAVELESEPGITFSVFCHTDVAEGVTIGGDVKYSLCEAQLTSTRALGVSNLMTGKKARVSVRSGTLLVFLYEASQSRDEGALFP